MEFNEKLQQLRKQAGLTQEQVAARLYVSRTAVSKWETGNGYPNLGTLQDIAALFGVTVDDLLSSKEILDLATTETDGRMKRMVGIVFGLLDLMVLSFFFLPLFSMSMGDFIAMVPLVDYAGQNNFLFIFSAAFILLAFIGCVELGAALLRRDRLCNVAMLCSMAVHVLAVLAFNMTREPYAVELLFVLLLLKVALVMYRASKLSR